MQTKSQPQPAEQYLRDTQVSKRYNVHRGTPWRWAADPSTGFPKPISLSPRVTVWALTDLLAFEATKAAKGRGA